MAPTLFPPPGKSQLIKNEQPPSDRGSYILITYYSFLQLFLDFLITGHFTKGCQLINNEEWPSQLWTLFTQLQFMHLHILHTPTAVSHSLLSREHTFVWTQNSPAPNIGGFIAQLVRASNKYHEVTGSNSVEVLNFFFRLFMQLHKLCSQLQGSFFICFSFCSSYIHL